MTFATHAAPSVRQEITAAKNSPHSPRRVTQAGITRPATTTGDCIVSALNSRMPHASSEHADYLSYATKSAKKNGPRFAKPFDDELAFI